jgi:hypothetical protein
MHGLGYPDFGFLPMTGEWPDLLVTVLYAFTPVGEMRQHPFPEIPS